MKGVLLPQLHGAVPIRLLPHSGRAERCAIAALLVDAGVIDAAVLPANWQPSSDDEIEIARAALERWLRRSVPHWSCLHPSFTIESVATDAAPAQPCAGEVQVSALRIRWSELYVAQWTVGAALERLEAAVPRLGATVLDLLDKQSVYPLFTPVVALEQASELYWYGEADESVMLEEYADQCDAQEIAAVRADIVTKADVDAAFPAWATDWCRKRLSQRTLAGLAASHPQAEIRAIAAMAQQLSRLRVDNPYQPLCEGSYLGFGAVLCWRDGDIAVRLSDAMAHFAWEGDADSCSDIGELTLPIGDAAGMRRWLRAMRRQLQVMRLIDRLLDALAARE